MAQPQKGKEQQPPQHQDHQPGIESEMKPRPGAKDRNYRACDKLENRVATITGGDSGIGRAVAITFAKEGADVGIVYPNEHADAHKARRQVEGEGHRCITIGGDVGDNQFCQEAVRRTASELGRLDIPGNSAAEDSSYMAGQILHPNGGSRQWLVGACLG